MTAYNRNTLIVGIAIALVTGGILSYFASSSLDGLEKTQERLGATQPLHGEVPAPPSVFEEYGLKGVESRFLSNAAAGVLGSLLVVGILLGAGYALSRRRRPASSAKAA